MLCAVAFKVVSDAFWAYLFVLDVPYKLPRTTPLLPHPFPPISLFFSPSLPGSRAESSGTLAKSCGTGVSMGFPHACSLSWWSLCSRAGFYQHRRRCFFSASHHFFRPLHPPFLAIVGAICASLPLLLFFSSSSSCSSPPCHGMLLSPYFIFIFCTIMTVYM